MISFAPFQVLSNIKELRFELFKLVLINFGQNSMHELLAENVEPPNFVKISNIFFKFPFYHADFSAIFCEMI